MQTMNFSKITAKRELPKHFQALIPHVVGVAEELQMSTAYISNVLNGHVHPSERLQIKLLKVYEFLKSEEAKAADRAA